MKNSVFEKMIKDLHAGFHIDMECEHEVIKFFMYCENGKYFLGSLAECFGGATSYPAFGAWITLTGELVNERITICEAFCDDKDLSTYIDKIYALCKDMKATMSQEAIALEIDNIMYFV